MEEEEEEEDKSSTLCACRDATFRNLCGAPPSTHPPPLPYALQGDDDRNVKNLKGNRTLKFAVSLLFNFDTIQPRKDNL